PPPGTRVYLACGVTDMRSGMDRLATLAQQSLGANRKRGDEARLPARVVNMFGRPGAGSFEPTLWSTLMTTRRVVGIAG
ncbi:MAG: IS66 family insertion sequence element accessory protein TnpB, partial [Geminicoccaceae bacterium]